MPVGIPFFVGLGFYKNNSILMSALEKGELSIGISFLSPQGLSQRPLRTHAKCSAQLTAAQRTLRTHAKCSAQLTAAQGPLRETAAKT